MKNFKIYIAGNTEKELVAPKQVVNVERFGTDIQLEYDRQHYLQLSDKYGKAVASRTKALEKGEVSKVKKADLDAKVETAKEALDTFKSELVERYSEDNFCPKPTNNRIASIYVWAYFKTGGTFTLTGMHSLYIYAKDYQATYNDTESFDADRQKAFKEVKDLCKQVIAPVFNTTSDGEDSTYKNFTLGATPAWVANNVCSFIWGSLSASSKGLKRSYGKEAEAQRQLILSCLEYLGIPVEDSVKVSAEESMETRMA